MDKPQGGGFAPPSEGSSSAALPGFAYQAGQPGAAQAQQLQSATPAQPGAAPTSSGATPNQSPPTQILAADGASKHVNAPSSDVATPLVPPAATGTTSDSNPGVGAGVASAQQQASIPLAVTSMTEPAALQPPLQPQSQSQPPQSQVSQVDANVERQPVITQVVMSAPAELATASGISLPSALASTSARLDASTQAMPTLVPLHTATSSAGAGGETNTSLQITPLQPETKQPAQANMKPQHTVPITVKKQSGESSRQGMLGIQSDIQGHPVTLRPQESAVDASREVKPLAGLEAPAGSDTVVPVVASGPTAQAPTDQAPQGVDTSKVQPQARLGVQMHSTSPVASVPGLSAIPWQPAAAQGTATTLGLPSSSTVSHPVLTQPAATHLAVQQPRKEAIGRDADSVSLQPVQVQQMQQAQVQRAQVQQAQPPSQPQPLQSQPHGQRQAPQWQPSPLIVQQPQPMQVPSSQPKPMITDALAYLDQVKNTFKEQPKVYNDFLDIMKDFKNKSIKTPGVIKRVSELFRGHRDLILQFNTFLPNGYKINEQDLDDVNHPAYVPPDPIEPAQAPVPMMVAPAIGVGPGQRQQTVHYPPGYTAPPGRPTEAAPGMPELQPVKAPKKVKSGSKASRAQKTAQGPLGGGMIGPSGGKGGKQIDFEQAIKYVNKIKQRFSEDADVYKQFLEILQTYSKEQKSITEVYEHVATLFKDHKDLLSEFKHFLPDQKNELQGNPMAGADSPRRGKGKGQGKGQKDNKDSPKRRSKKEKDEKKDAWVVDPKEMAFFKDLKRQLSNAELHKEFLKCLNLYTEEMIGRDELLVLIEELFGRGHQAAYVEFRKFILEKAAAQERTAAKIKLTLAEQLNLWKTKPMSEVPDETCQRIGSSYRSLPEHFPRPLCSGRLEDSGQGRDLHKVLNDDYVSVPTGSETGPGAETGQVSFRHISRNKFEENLFKAEDERYEMDMLIEANASAVQELDEIQLQFKDLPNEEKLRFELPKPLNPIHKRGIERVYGAECEEQILRLLKTNPAVAVPVVLDRLKQKNDEWVRSRVDCSRTWKKVYENNFNKALDHRSFYFKQTDKKAIGAKSFVSEISELPTGGTLQHTLPFTPEAHADTMEIVKFAMLEEFGSQEEIDECLDFWDDIINGLYDIDKREADIERAKSGAKAEAKFAGLLVDEFDGSDCVTDDEADGSNDMKADDEARDASPENDATHMVAGDRRDASTAASCMRPLEEDTNEETKGEPYISIYENTKAHMRQTRHKPITMSNLDPHYQHLASDHRKLSARQAKKLNENYAAVQRQVQGDQTCSGSVTASDSDTTGAVAQSIGEIGSSTTCTKESVGLDTTVQSAGATSTAGARFSSFVSLIPLVSGFRGSTQHGWPIGHGIPSQHMVFYANETSYIFLRLHQVLCARLSVARQLAEKKDAKMAQKKSAAPTGMPVLPLLRHSPSKSKGTEKKAYDEFTSVLCAWLAADAPTDTQKYEDTCRELLGTSSYVLFTLDKVISKLIRQLYNCATDTNVCCELLRLHAQHKSRVAACRGRGTPSGGLESVYREAVCDLLRRNNEGPIFRFEFCAPGVSDHGDVIAATLGEPAAVARSNLTSLNLADIEPRPYEEGTLSVCLACRDANELLISSSEDQLSSATDFANAAAAEASGTAPSGTSFLPRNIRKCNKRQRLAGAVFHNGLEMTIGHALSQDDELEEEFDDVAFKEQSDGVVNLKMEPAAEAATADTKLPSVDVAVPADDTSVAGGAEDAAKSEKAKDVPAGGADKSSPKRPGDVSKDKSETEGTDGNSGAVSKEDIEKVGSVGDSEREGKAESKSECADDVDKAAAPAEVEDAAESNLEKSESVTKPVKKNNRRKKVSRILAATTHYMPDTEDWLLVRPKKKKKQNAS